MRAYQAAWSKKNPGRQKEWYRANKDKRRAYYLKWREKMPQSYREAVRRSNLKKSYGITLEYFEEMMLEQSGKCAICMIELVRERHKRGSVNVDHCHSTGRVRGLLCSECNRALGQFNEDPVRMRSAADYMDRQHKRKTA